MTMCRLERPEEHPDAGAQTTAGSLVVDEPTSAIPTGPADWYAGAYPSGPRHDPRCLAVLGAWQPLYNINRAGKNRPDGGFRACGTGVEVRAKGEHLATYDFDSLTRLVVAAHRYRCRVEISALMGMLVIWVHPRSADGEHLFERHPGLHDLAARASR